MSYYFEKYIDMENPKFKRNVSLITMGAGNVIALKKTLESFKNAVTEVIYGDLLIFQEDREIVESYQSEYNLKIIPFGFNYIFKNGFSAILNELAAKANNDLVLYMNTSEIIDGEERILRLINELFWEYNCFAFDHATDPNTWYRMIDKTCIHWEGLIHEEPRGEIKQCPYYIFRMKDESKDNDDIFKAAVMDDIKNIVYFQQYLKLVEQPELRSCTNEYWINFSLDQYESLKERQTKKGKRLQAFIDGDLDMYLKDAYENLSSEEFKSNKLIDYQQDKTTLI